MPNFPYKITTIFIFSIFVAVVFVSCNEVESTYKYPVPQTQPSLTGTVWKCLGFYDIEADYLRKIWDDNLFPFQYTLKFITDSTAACNAWGGNYAYEYKVDYLKSTIKFEWIKTVVDWYDTQDGWLFWHAIWCAEKFSYKNEELKLFYNSIEEPYYLLFKPYEVPNNNE